VNIKAIFFFVYRTSCCVIKLKDNKIVSCLFVYFFLSFWLKPENILSSFSIMAIGRSLSLEDMLIFKSLVLGELVVGEGTTGIRWLSEIRSVKQMGLHIVLQFQV